MTQPDASRLRNAPHNPDEIPVDLERRQTLALKGQRLYAKYCGTKGRGICAESFAEYHIWIGELDVARDFLVFLETQLDQLRQIPDPDTESVALFDMTTGLYERIQHHLGVGKPIPTNT